MTKRSVILSILALCAIPACVPICVVAQQKFETLSDASEPTIAGRPVQLDAKGKLMPWPQANDTGFSYSSHFLTQWTILKDQLERTKIP